MAIFENFKRHHIESLVDERSLLHEFSGILIKSLVDREIMSWVVKDGVIVERYEPDFFKGYDISLSIDLTEEISRLEEEDVYGSGAWIGKAPFIYKNKPFTGMAYWFDDSSDTPDYHREFLLKDGRIVARLEWEKGVLAEAYHHGCEEDSSLNYFSQGYYWTGDVLEYDFDGGLFSAGFSKYNLTNRNPPLIPDLEVRFARRRGNNLSVIEIVGSLDNWGECIKQAIYWPYHTLESLFSAWECSEKYFVLTGNAFDDNLWRMFVKYGKTKNISNLTLIDVCLTDAVISTFGSFPNLKELFIRTKHEASKALGMQAKEYYPDIKIIIEN